MADTLLTQLMRALSQYAVYRVKHAFGRSGPQEPPAQGNEQAPQRNSEAHGAPIYEPVGCFDWQVLGEPEKQLYAGGPPLEALDLLVQEPRFVLDIGCSIGDFALNVKQRFPKSRVWGIEPNEHAARIATARLDRVLCGTLEEIDWTHEGVQRGDIDTVLLCDVLEHMYDPWKTLLTLRNLVAPTAQLLISIPNVRNVLLIQDLVSGYWRYRQAGLLDITHIRFFTQKDMYRMFYQTGFRVAATAATYCPGSVEILEKHKGAQFPSKIELDSASITAHSLEDLKSLCTLQHLFLLQPADYDQLSIDERQLVDAPHPPTLAFSPDLVPLTGIPA